MPSRAPGILIFFTVLLANLSGLLCFAQEARPVPQVRYHFGDNRQWADANFDDSTWPVAPDGRWPLPEFYSDGVVWVRERLPVTDIAPGALAVRITGRNSFLIADELYVNGVFVGRQGSMPPHAAPVAFGRDVVFNLPPGTVQQGAIAVVAFRAWYSPGMRPASGRGYANFTIGESRMLHLTRHADHSDSLIEAGLNLALNGIVFLLGAGLLVFRRSAGGRDLLVCSWMLIGAALMPLWGESVRLGFIPASLWVYAVTFTALQALSMAATVELVWTVHGLRAAGLRRLYHACWVVSSCAFLVLNLAVKPGPIVLVSQLVMMPALLVFDSIQLAVNLWALISRKSNRLIAVALAAIPVADILQNYGHLRSLSIGPFRENYFGISLFLCDFALFIMLGQRAWKAWRTRDELRVEFDAAREVQQNSIAQVTDVPGFRIESAYLPASQVGGDFFRILPESNGGVIVVLGDVSGKGLKAAMSVSAIMGALQVCPSEKPAEILAYLNRLLCGRVGGFVTCCVALIETDGNMTLANAGHPAPYRNGEEMAVEPGLPMGILLETSHREVRHQLSPGDRLTFISDGVVEATNPKGELYGFERTQAISTQPASSIAEAATSFGQEDDITVLSITFEGAAKPFPAPPKELSTAI